jgi:type IV pilus assembly protein PilA
MLQRLRKSQENEKGFTLIELLVVILIIAILAAIAIPVFLRQREKGYVAQMESALKNAATAQESCLTDVNCEGNEYTADIDDLLAEGLRYDEASVTFDSIVPDGADGYVMTVSHANHDCTYVYDSEVGAPEEGTCAA